MPLATMRAKFFYYSTFTNVLSFTNVLFLSCFYVFNVFKILFWTLFISMARTSLINLVTFNSKLSNWIHLYAYPLSLIH